MISYGFEDSPKSKAIIDLHNFHSLSIEKRKTRWDQFGLRSCAPDPFTTGCGDNDVINGSFFIF